MPYVPPGWELVPLGELGNYINGRAFKPEDWDSSGLPIVRIQNLTNADAPYNYYSEPVEQRYYIKTGDLLISWSATLGAYIWDRGDAILNQHIFKVEENRERVDKLFLKYAVEHALEELSQHTHGTTMRHVTKGKFEAFEVPVPRSLAEQRRIVARIETLFAELRGCQKTLSELQTETGRLMTAVRHEVFSTLSQTEKTKFFDEVADSRLGKMLNQAAQRGTNPKPYLRNANVLWDKFLLDDVLEMDFTAHEEETFRLHSGDLLICEGGDIGRTAVWEDQLPECYFQKALHRARLRDSKASPRYLMHYMAWATRNGAIAKLRTGAAIPHLTGVKLKTLDVIWPEPKIQIEITDYLDSVGCGIKDMQNTQQDDCKWFQEMEQSILNQAFRGEL
jgi:type I restriction enzyme S subunit